MTSGLALAGEVPDAGTPKETARAKSATRMQSPEQAAPQFFPDAGSRTDGEAKVAAPEPSKDVTPTQPSPAPGPAPSEEPAAEEMPAAAAQPVGAATVTSAAPEAPSALDDLSLSQMFEIGVVASKHPETTADAPASITVLTAERFNALGLKNLNDVLQLVPGFDVRRSREQVQLITVRGVTSELNEHLLIMIDGVRLGALYEGGAGKDVRQINLTDVERIEIIRGPGSALYGTGAFAAVVSVITKKGSDTKGIHVTGEIGSYATAVTDVTAGQTFGAFNLNGHFGYAESKGENFFIAQDGAGISSHIRDPYKEFSGNLKLGYKDMLELSVNASHQVNSAFITTGDVMDPNSYGKATWIVTSLDHNHAFSKSLKWQSELYIAYHQRGPTVALLMPPGLNAKFPDGQYGHPSLTDMRYGLDTYASYAPIQNMTLIAGIAAELSTTSNQDHVSNGPDYAGVPATTFFTTPNRTVLAGYAQGDYRFLKGLKLTAGVRYDHYNDLGGTTNPRVALVYNYHDKAWVKGLFATAFRAPNYRELHATTPTITGNPNSKAETIMTGELVFGIAPWRRLLATVSLFDSQVSNLIFKFTPTDSRVSTFQNRGNLDALGVEAEIRTEILPGFEVAGNYTYVHSKSTDLGNTYDTPLVSHHTANFTISRDLYHHVRLSVLGEYRSAKTRYVLASDVNNTDPRPPCGEVMLIGAYARVYDLVEGVAGYVRVTNALDFQYQTPSTYPPKVTGVIPDDIHNRGIEIQTGLTYSFK